MGSIEVSGKNSGCIKLCLRLLKTIKEIRFHQEFQKYSQPWLFPLTLNVKTWVLTQMPPSVSCDGIELHFISLLVPLVSWDHCSIESISGGDTQEPMKLLSRGMCPLWRAARLLFKRCAWQQAQEMKRVVMKQAWREKWENTFKKDRGRALVQQLGEAPCSCWLLRVSTPVLRSDWPNT